MEGSSLAYVFDAVHGSDDDMYPLLDGPASPAPLSPDDQALLMGMYPATLTDLDFVATMQALPHHEDAHNAHSAKVSSHPVGAVSQLHDPSAGVLSTSVYHGLDQSMLSSPFFASNGRVDSPKTDKATKQTSRPAVATTTTSRGRARSSSPANSPTTSTNGSDSGFRDSEEILNAPVKSLTEEEKKLRRRAQVAKSARKHRNRQKEELARLREQVQMLQEQMANMMHHSGAESAERIKLEQDVITHHRKRKKVDDDDCDDASEVALITAQATATVVPGDLGFTTAPSVKIQHWFHHVPVDTLQRAKMLHNIANKRMDMALQYIHSEFGVGPPKYPLMDIKLNSNGPDIEIKLLRAKQLPGFTHEELGEACWNSIFNFQFDIPERFQPHVQCERLMELDANTRYGRTVAPLLKDYEENRIVYLHSYFVVHRRVVDQYVVITWETIALDDLYPPAADESPEFTLRNDEVGCMIMETEPMPNGGVRALYRSILHSTPPVTTLTHPRSKLNESFLTVFCRNADIVEASARNLLVKNHPDRVNSPEIVA